MKNVFAAFALLVIFTAATSTAQTTDNWGIGFRLGDPSGITFKRYLANKAIELSVGRTRIWKRFPDHWYGNHFYNWYGKNNFPYEDYKYDGYHVSIPLAVQLHVLFHKDLAKDGELTGLDWYYGVGGQLRIQSYYFDYRYKLEGDDEWYRATGERITDFDAGVDGVLGLEYRFKKAPISIFVDGTLFMEVVDDPFLFWLQGGTGLRYNF